MSRNFIGSQIAIVTKSQCRYVGTIIGIDSQTSSILLGNVKCFGTENRPGSLTNGSIVGTTLPIMQFANSDIEDLKIVDDDQASETPQQQSRPMPVISSPPVPSQQSSIHDDPAIVSAVISSSKKDSTPISLLPNRLIHDLHQMTLSNEQSKTLPKNEESRVRSNSGELGASWSLLSPSKWGNNNNNNNSKPLSQQQQQQQHSGNKSKFFDDFVSNNSNNTDQFQSNRYHQRSSNTHSTQTLRENGSHYNGQDEDESGLPVRQPFFSNDQSYPQHQLQPQQDRHQQNGNMQHQQRCFYNNRRPPMSNQQRRTGGGGGGNRETFQYNTNSYDADFDFETSNRKFNKLSSEDEFKPNDLTTNQFIQSQLDTSSKTEYAPLYDKKISFFDNIALTESSDTPPSSMFNRSKNKDTFGNDGYQRQNNRPMNSGYRRSNNNNYRQQQQQGNDDFYYRQNNNNNNNGYHYRY